ncbi:MAG: hypothetical protein V1648_03275 [Candidatus Aenigmatarchaeota archaeon]
MQSRKLIEEVDNYILTVQALIALGEHLKIEHSANYFLGKKMKTSTVNTITPNEDVTPDEVIQLDTSNGMIVEAKKSFSKTHTHESMEKCFEQMKKYDDDLIGWNTENEKIDNHEISILTQISRSRELSEFIESKISTQPFHRVYNIIEFARNDQTRFFIFLRHFLSNSRYNHSKLKNGVDIWLEHLQPMISDIKFYDAEPPILYIMIILWQNVFGSIATDEQLEESRGKKIIRLVVNVNDLLNKLKTFSLQSNGNHDVPSVKSVKEAMETFEKIGLASKIDDNKYDVKFHRIKVRNLIEHFAEKMCSGGQLTLENILSRSE